MRWSLGEGASQEAHLWRRRSIAGCLAVLGIASPLIFAALAPSVSPRAAMICTSGGLLCLAIATVFFEWSERVGLVRRVASWEPAVQQMRGASLRIEQIQRKLAEVDANTNAIRTVRHLLNDERHNLSLVASGMVEIRGMIDVERANLSALAAGVHEVRIDSSSLREIAERAFSEVGEFAEIVLALRVHLDAMSTKLLLLEEHSAAEQKNLGLVASGLDVVRRAASGIEKFEARQAAFEDVLVSISDQLDAIDLVVAASNEAA